MLVMHARHLGRRCPLRALPRGLPVSRRTDAAAVVAGLVALHEHRQKLSQDRRLAGKPALADTGSWRFITWIMLGLTTWALLALIVAIVVAIWQWVLAAATGAAIALVVRARRRR